MANIVCELLSSRVELERPMPGGDARSGAALDFRGVVREREDDRLIDGLEYEAHPGMAQHQLERIAAQVADRFRLYGAIIRHRVGFVPAGEVSLFIRLIAAHRTEVLQAMPWLIDELKRKVPIWKHPRFSEINSPAPAVSETVLP